MQQHPRRKTDMRRIERCTVPAPVVASRSRWHDLVRQQVQTGGRVILLIGFLYMGASAEDAKPPTKDGVHFFKQSIQPILAKNCFRCHSHSANKANGGLVVDSIEGLLAGGDTGPAIVPGKPAESPLVQ